MVEVIIAISFIVAISALLTIVARIIKQPPIIAYLFAGVVVGPLILNIIGVQTDSSNIIQTFARIGVAFLLFIVGLSLDFRLLKEIGKVSTLAGIAEIILVGIAGYFLATWMGFGVIGAIYIAAALTFSSTVVVVKILSDKKEIDTLHGRIALGILIIQDIVAAIALMILPMTDNLGANSQTLFLNELGLVVLVIFLVFLISAFIFKKMMDYLAKSQEALFLFGIAWALILATLFSKLGFSMEIGALIAGMSLASSKYAIDLSGKMKPLRDFFMVLFFVFFGSQLTAINSGLMINAIILSLFVIIIKPLIVMIILKVFGYTKKTNLLASLSLAQISEFSLIIVMLGFSLGQLDQDVMNLTILVALITIAFSTYFINYSDWICKKLLNLKIMSLFDGKLKCDDTHMTKNYDIVLFGYHRVGYKLLQRLKKMKESVVVIDYNPKVVLSLNKQGIDAIYGDVGNRNFLDELPLSKAKIIISTVPEESANLLLSETLREIKSDAIFIATAEQPRQAIELYKSGADYVLIPHHLGGWYASEIIDKYKTDKKKYREMGHSHFKELNHAKNSSNFKD
jgi:Kef-type K+ transport system membrane component KefB